MTNNKREELIGGGYLVRITSGSGLGVEGVAGARRGLVVQSAWSHMDGDHRCRGSYRLTVRVVQGTDLWHVRQLDAAVEPADEATS